MAILSTFKSFEKYIPVDGNWQLVSERTSAKDIIFNDNKDLEAKMSGLSLVVLTEEEYQSLETKDANTLYIRPKVVN